MLKEFKKGEIFALAIVTLFGIVALVITFTNAHLTQTQLFIEYWWLWGGMIITLVFIVLVVFRE